MADRFLTARWRHLVMLNYRVNPALLEDRVPRGTRLDPDGGEHWVSLVGFLFLDTALLGIPVPLHRNFEEVNLRFYVARDVPDAKRDAPVRRGVAFIKELVPKSAIATVARLVYNENYVSLPMEHRLLYDGREVAADTTLLDGTRVEYDWGHGSERGRLAATVAGSPHAAERGSHPHYIAEHYWGYAAQRDGGTVEYEVEHPPWRVWEARGPTFLANIPALYGQEWHDVLSREPDSAFIAEGSEVTVFRGVRLDLDR
ncbi:MAG: DUF2071 domain-containing protein [Deltaproteobacteria bacterium]|nr:DUF2071 domain-containing protein [Deltaproteobacteria bacterium]